MKFSLAAQFLSPAFAAAIASPSLVSLAEAATKKYDTHRDIDAAAAAAAAAATSRAGRNLDSIDTTSTSKSSKSSVSCPPEPTPDVECGKTYVDSTVTLGQNLVCNGNITEADGSLNAALTLEGEKAVLDCQGFTISQETVRDGSAAAMDCPIFAPAGNATAILEMKKGCDLFYVAGVKLLDGAKMKNCNIQKFYFGGNVTDGGVIEDSEFSLNWLGVEIFNRAANTVSKIANSEIYNNKFGLTAENDANSNIMIKDVTSKNNQIEGMYLTGTGITVNNANLKNNGAGGLSIGHQRVNEITLAGDIYLTNNKFGFLTDNNNTNFPQGKVYVTGNLIANHNKYGVVSQNPNDQLTVAVGGSYSGKSGKSVGSGSLTACDNYGLDIANYVGGGGITFEGSDYTCGKSAGDVPDCKPCYPDCSSSDSEDGSGRTLGLTLSDFVAGDLDFADMGHEEFPL